MYSLYWCGNDDQRIFNTVLKIAKALPLLDVMGCGQQKLPFEQLLVRYDKKDTAYDFPPDKMNGAQWTTLVTDSHEIAGNVCGFNAGDLWKSIFVVKLGFPEFVQFPDDNADLRKAPFIKYGPTSRTGLEFWVGKTVPATHIGVIPLKSKDGMFSL